MAASLNRAIEAVKSSSELARRLNISPQAVSQWDIAPLERVIEIERETGVSRFDLRPDVFAVPLPRKLKGTKNAQEYANNATTGADHSGTEKEEKPIDVDPSSSS